MSRIDSELYNLWEDFTRLKKDFKVIEDRIKIIKRFQDDDEGLKEIAKPLIDHKRGNYVIVREEIQKLIEQDGKLVSLDKLRRAVNGLTDIEFEETLKVLANAGHIFTPKQGFIQKV